MSSRFTQNDPVIISALRAGSIREPAHHGPHSEIQGLEPELLFSFKGAVSRNSAKLGNYKMRVKLRET